MTAWTYVLPFAGYARCLTRGGVQNLRQDTKQIGSDEVVLEVVFERFRCQARSDPYVYSQRWCCSHLDI